MDGRVKTLHPHIHGGLLARRGVDDAVLDEHGIGAIDLLGRESLSVRGDDGAARIAPTPRRSRTSTSAARRCCAPPRRITSTSPSSSITPTTTPCSRRSRTAGVPARDAPRARDQGVQPHGPLRRGDQPLPAHAQRDARRLAEPAAAQLAAHAAAALRREPASARRALPHVRARAGHGRARAAAAGQGAVVQQPRRRRCRVQGRQGVRRGGVRDREAREPVRHRNGGLAGRPPISSRIAPTRPRRSAASSRSIAPLDQVVGGSDRRPAVRRGHHRARGRQGGARARSRRSQASACSRPGWPTASSAAREPSFELKTIEGGLLVQSTDDGRVDVATAKVVTQRAADARASCAI